MEDNGLQLIVQNLDDDVRYRAVPYGKAVAGLGKALEPVVGLCDWDVTDDIRVTEGLRIPVARPQIAAYVQRVRAGQVDAVMRSVCPKDATVCGAHPYQLTASCVRPDLDIVSNSLRANGHCVRLL